MVKQSKASQGGHAPWNSPIKPFAELASHCPSPNTHFKFQAILAMLCPYHKSMIKCFTACKNGARKLNLDLKMRWRRTTTAWSRRMRQGSAAPCAPWRGRREQKPIAGNPLCASITSASAMNDHWIFIKFFMKMQWFFMLAEPKFPWIFFILTGFISLDVHIFHMEK